MKTIQITFKDSPFVGQQKSTVTYENNSNIQ